MSDDVEARLARVEQWIRAWGRGDGQEQARIWAELDPDMAALSRHLECNIGPPPLAPVPIVGDPGWIPSPPPVERQTTTELVATLQRRYPDDAEVRALIAKVTANHEEVRAAGELAAKAAGEADMLRRRLAASESQLGARDVFAIFDANTTVAKAALRSVRLEEPTAAEVSRDWLVVEKRRAIIDADGRLCLLELVPSDLDEVGDE